MRIGIIGGGQLGRMLALSGYPLGFTFLGLEPAPYSPLSQVAPCIEAAYDSPEGLRRLAAETDVVTFEFENVPARSVEILLEAGATVHPNPDALRHSQDRLVEKELFRSLGIPTVRFAKVDSEADLRAALTSIGTPGILKTRRFGYDGKGQLRIASADITSEARSAADRGDCIYEQCVTFSRELSVIAARSAAGELRVYPLCENTHRDGILRTTIAPAPDTSTAESAAAPRYVQALLETLHYVGVAALELFEVGGTLVANEFAPRVHNSGHWTQDGSITSQFENHLRAVAGLPLGATEARAPSAMVNLIGSHPPREAFLRHPDLKLHLYGKDPRPGRKVGHVNFSAPTVESLTERIQAVSAFLG